MPALGLVRQPHLWGEIRKGQKAYILRQISIMIGSILLEAKPNVEHPASSSEYYPRTGKRCLSGKHVITKNLYPTSQDNRIVYPYSNMTAEL
jgi:hypothetical protein